MINLDHNATTPVDPRVRDALLPYLGDHFGNPSSSHAHGDAPKLALAQARAQVARLIGARSGQIVFTGSGSEANHLALRGLVLGRAPRGSAAVVTQPTEHPSVLATAESLQRHHGAVVRLLPVDRTGIVSPDDLDAQLREVGGTPTVVSLMAANNETGALQPIRELAAVARHHGAVVHCDAAQAVGKVALDVEEVGVDLLTIVGHKMYAPKGVAALWIGAGVTLEPISYGGSQESGLRAGTENVAWAVALGAAAELAAADLVSGGPERAVGLRDRLHAGLERGLPGRVRLNGPREQRLPNTLNVSIDGLLSHQLLKELPQIAASTGSACHSGDDHTPSPVLTAMGHTPERGLGAMRFSVGRGTTTQQIDETIGLVVAAVRAGG